VLQQSVIVALEISNHKVGVALAQTPDHRDYYLRIRKLDPITYLSNKLSGVSLNQRKLLKDHVYSTVQHIVKENKACGFVVGWPLQPDGRPGAACGQVLHLLDYFSNKSNPVLSKGRPFALWDERFLTHKLYEEIIMPQDEWGRSIVYSRTPALSPRDALTIKEGVYRSRSQIYQPVGMDSSSAGIILEQFMNSHFGSSDARSDYRHHIFSNQHCHDDSQNPIENYDSGLYLESSLL